MEMQSPGRYLQHDSPIPPLPRWHLQGAARREGHGWALFPATRPPFSWDGHSPAAPCPTCPAPLEQTCSAEGPEGFAVALRHHGQLCLSGPVFCLGKAVPPGGQDASEQLPVTPPGSLLKPLGLSSHTNPLVTSAVISCSLASINQNIYCTV